MSNRPDWHQTWLDIAAAVARRSYDPKWKVGAIIVSEDNTTMLALGYNGNYPGGPHERDSDDVGASGFIHAEENALIKAPYHYPQPKVMYVTVSPCYMCAKKIINAGISRVIYTQPYTTNMTGVELLNSVDIPCKSIEAVHLFEAETRVARELADIAERYDT